MKLSSFLSFNIKKRIIDALPFISIGIHKKGQRDISNSIKLYRNLDNETLDFILELIYNQQGTSIDFACDRSTDWIKIPGLGTIRRNKSRHEILKTILEKGEISNEDTYGIIMKNVEIKKALREDTIITEDITYNGKTS